jgi:import inner membrane translocase subunit TIM54
MFGSLLAITYLPLEAMSTPTPPSAPSPAPVVAANPAAPPAAPAKPGVIGSMSALEHTGLPPSLLRWKPRLPSRNWTIFLSIVGGVSYLYFDDRRKCNQIKQEYIDKVKHLAEVPLSSSMEYPRKVTVYAAKWPEDDDYERGLQYFKRYLKVRYSTVNLERSNADTRFLL